MEDQKTLKQVAEEYEAEKTKVISDLDQVSTKLETHLFEGLDQEHRPYNYYYIEIDGQKYRVPTSVISQLKAMLEAKPEMKIFKVNKTGIGMQTKYTLIPL